MKLNMDSIQLESRREAELLQNVLEIALADFKCLTDEECDIAKEASKLLESMWLSW